MANITKAQFKNNLEEQITDSGKFRNKHKNQTGRNRIR